MIFEYDNLNDTMIFKLKLVYFKQMSRVFVRLKQKTPKM